jgi:4-hydroxybenzoate polyprenyltransferase
MEALFWMTRPSSAVIGLLAVPGWLAASAPPGFGRMSAMVAAVMLGRMIVNIVNDILDEEKDRITAPELPLPSGLVTLPQAALTAGFLLLCVLALLFVAGGSPRGFFLAAGGIAAGGLLIGCYSFVKPYAIASMTVTGGAFVSAPVAAWLVAGGGVSPQICAVVLYAFLRGLGANVFSTLRDVDVDGKVGNYSVAVRLGPERALKLGVLLEVLAAFCVFWVAAADDHFLLGGVVVGLSLFFLLGAYQLMSRQQQKAAGRYERIWVALPVNLARHHVAVILVQSIPIGCAALGLTAVGVALDVIPMYKRRIIEGELAAAFRNCRPAPATIKAGVDQPISTRAL